MTLSVFLGVSVSTAAAQLYGDVDGDDDVTILDVTLIQRSLADVIQLDEDAQKRGDVDADDELTILDATMIQRYLVGVINQFPSGEFLPTQAPTIAPTEAPT